MLCLQAFKDPSLLDPVRKWIADGLLEFAAGDDNVLNGLLFLKGVKPTPADDDEGPQPATKKQLATKANEAKPVAAMDRSLKEPEKSWPYECGEWQRSEDRKTGKPTPNPCTGESGVRWQAGYDGTPEPPIKPVVCPCCQREAIRQGKAASGRLCESCESVLFPKKAE